MNDLCCSYITALVVKYGISHTKKVICVVCSESPCYYANIWLDSMCNVQYGRWKLVEERVCFFVWIFNHTYSKAMLSKSVWDNIKLQYKLVERWDNSIDVAQTLGQPTLLSGNTDLYKTWRMNLQNLQWKDYRFNEINFSCLIKWIIYICLARFHWLDLSLDIMESFLYVYDWNKMKLKLGRFLDIVIFTPEHSHILLITYIWSWEKGVSFWKYDFQVYFSD